MNSKLKYVQNWQELAPAANWSVVLLAKRCGVSVRTLHRHFVKHMKKNTKAWLAEQRLNSGRQLLRKGLSIKETAIYLHYKHPGNLSRTLNKVRNFCPLHKSSVIYSEKMESVRK